MSSEALPSAEASGSRSGSFKHVGNKAKRLQLYEKYKKDKKKLKLQRRIQQAKEEKSQGGSEKKRLRLAKNVPRTIENTRDFNPTIINAPNTHAGVGPILKEKSENEEEEEIEPESVEIVNENDDDEIDDNNDNDDEDEDDDDPHAPPALIITTSMPSNSFSPHLVSGNARLEPSEKTRGFVNELLDIFPGAEYRQRSKAKGAGLGKIAGWARERGYNGMIIIGEDKKEPFSLTIIQLPNGPTAFFRLTNIVMRKEIQGHGKPTDHTPELILNNFTTTLGHQIGSIFQSLFPKIPQLEGRQVVTAHNQRDYIFFRRHRYAFASEDKAKLQEIGPQFTLKLRQLNPTLPKGAGVWDEEIHFDGKIKDEKIKRGYEEEPNLSFQWKPKMSVSRRNFYL